MTNPTAISSPPVKVSIQHVELGAGLLITLLAISAHVYFYLHAGGLWRDEANSANMAAVSLGQIWEKLHYDTFPLAHVFMLKIWTAVFGDGDGSLRFNGLLVGVALLGMIWLCARWMGIVAPVLALALAGLNAVLIRYGDSLRPYGLGAALGVLCIGVLWRLKQDPSLPRMIVATIVCILNVHTSYQNCTVVLGCCVAAATVGAVMRNSKLAISSIAAGAIAALSLLIYVEPLHAAQDWMLVLQTSGSQNIGQAIQGAFGGGVTTAVAAFLMAGLWLIFILGFIAIGIWATYRCWEHQKSAAEPDPLAWRDLYCIVMFSVTAFALLALIISGGFQTEPWHFLPLLAPAAVCVDVVSGGLIGMFPATRIVRMCVALFLSLTMAPGCFSRLATPQTNIDKIANVIALNAQKQDLVLVAPWFMGVSFSRYYHGPADWMTIPPMADHSVHRYDLIKLAMLDPTPVNAAIQRVISTIMSGGKIWIAGPLTIMPSAQVPAQIPIPPNSPWGWKSSMYTMTWESKVGQAIQMLVTHGGQVNVDQNAQDVERLPLLVAWRAIPATAPATEPAK